MQLAIISDSHYDFDTLAKLLTHLKKNGIAHLAHAGDFVTSGVEQLFEKHPELNVFIAIGNCDTYSDVLPAMRKLPNVVLDDIVSFELEDIRIVVCHQEHMAQRVLTTERVDVFIHGHTHRPRVETKNGTLILNPGSLMDGAGYMVLEIPSLKVDRRLVFD